MPEGPSIVLLREEVAAFAGKKILRASGTSKIDMDRLVGRRVKSFRSWGKHFLIEFPGFAIRIHFLMFGSHLVDARKDREPRLTLDFGKRELNFYSCAVRYLEGDLDDVYDWSGDVLADGWNPRAALKKLRTRPERVVCDVLLDQDIFAGVGNIIKNEALFRVRVHPLSTVGALPAAKLRAVVAQAREYSFDFLAWKRAFVLRKHWQVHNQRNCPRCDIPLVKSYLGESNRRTFHCERCQKRYGGPA